VSVTTFTTVNGRILRQNKDGVVHNFVSDPLGSVVMVRDTSGNTVYEAEYDPYGNVQSETGTNPSSLGYVGTLGYIKDSATSMYVRARYLLNNLGRWLTKDPLWPSEAGYVYAGSEPTVMADPSGAKPGCDARTADYCKTAKEWGYKNYGFNCFCRVSNMICDFIKWKGNKNHCQVWADCINKCLYDCVMKGVGCSPSTAKCWDRVFVPGLGNSPGSPCQQIYDSGCISSHDDERHDSCCRSMVFCEQEQLGYCNSRSGPCGKLDIGCSATFGWGSLGTFPFGKGNADRQAAAYRLCCQKKVWQRPFVRQPRMDPMPFGGM
jgi:RHS repeat-associated protein